jgi:Flp pilus assembly protein CpaB
VSRRARAVAFAAGAAICAGLAAGAAGQGGPGLGPQLGELRPAVVTTAALPAGRRVSPRTLSESVEVRRVPARFLPPDALGAPEHLVGRAPLAEVPAGSYVLASHLRSPTGAAARPGARLDRGSRPVEIAVTGGGAIAGARAQGRRVDVIVTAEGSPAGGPGRTYVAARAVELVELRPASGGTGAQTLPGPGLDAWIATLALTRGQALRLIHAESFARSVRLIGS